MAATVPRPRHPLEAPTHTIHPRRLAALLVGVILLLELGHVVAVLLGGADVEGAHLLGEVLDLDGEGTIPALAEVGLLFAGGALSALAAAASGRRTGTGRGWAVLGVVLLLFGFSEGAELHEALGGQLAEWAGGTADGLYHVVAVAFVASVAAVVVPLLRGVPRSTRLLVLGAATTFLLGAAGAEVVGQRIADDAGRGSWAYEAEVMVEEGLELAGVGLYLLAVVDWFGRTRGVVELRIATLGARPVSDPGARRPGTGGS